jgi:hypothetical protein
MRFGNRAMLSVELRKSKVPERKQPRRENGGVSPDRIDCLRWHHDTLHRWLRRGPNDFGQVFLAQNKKSPRTRFRESPGMWGNCCPTVLKLFGHRSEGHSGVIDFENQRC